MNDVHSQASLRMNIADAQELVSRAGTDPGGFEGDQTGSTVGQLIARNNPSRDETTRG